MFDKCLTQIRFADGLGDFPPLTFKASMKHSRMVAGEVDYFLASRGSLQD
jgi:hypothetical protein